MFKSICNAIAKTTVKVYAIMYKLFTGLETHKFEDVIELPSDVGELDEVRLIGNGYADTKIGTKTNILGHVVTVYGVGTIIGLAYILSLVGSVTLSIFAIIIYTASVYGVRELFKTLREISISIARTKIRANHSVKEVSNFNKVGE